MKIAIFLSLMLTGAFASADQFKTVKVDASTERYPSTYSYPELLPGSVPAYASITAQVRARLAEDQCEQPDAESMDYYFEAVAEIVGLNKAYVGVKMTGSSFCGGAHPSHYVYYMTFDSNTGNAMNIGKEFGFTEDYQTNDKIQAKLAKLLINKIPAGDEEADACYGNMTRAEKLETLQIFYPVVHGLAKNKTVVIGISPPYAATACRFDVRFTYAEIKSFLVRGSFLHKLLQ